MASLTPGQRATRERFEGMIALAAPVLNLVLGLGERISRIAEPTDHEYYPIRPGGPQLLPGEEPLDAEAEADGSAEPPQP
ncbi:MAG TPA: hypothetical protein VKA36_04630 [Solirubrobacterales bacterium]|nr:hypothetical protein [Solirubrobacterales bacterium]